MTGTTVPLVSVVMPAFNAAATIGVAASSALWQTGVDVEVVVVDDGSTDATAAIAAALDGPIRVLSQANRGVAAARNAGIAAAKGEFIAFCDADDFLFETHVTALLDTWRAQARGGIATANALWWRPGGIRERSTRHRGRFPAPADQRLALLASNYVSTMSLVSRELLEAMGGFDESLRQGEDWELWLRIVFAGYRVAHQPRPLALYRLSPDGLTSQRESFYAAERVILERVAGWPGLTEPERELVRRRLSGPPPRELLRQVDRSIIDRDYRRAAQLQNEAAALVPTETMLVRKARLLRAAPFLVGPLLRRRLAGSEGALGPN